MTDTGNNGNGQHIIPRRPSSELVGWPKRGDVARALQCSTGKVRDLEDVGKLHPVLDDSGHHRFDPTEIDTVANEIASSGAAGADYSASTYYEKEVIMSRARGGTNGGGDPTEAYFLRTGVSLLGPPRLALDSLFFRMLDRQERRIIHLESELDKKSDRIKAMEQAEQDALDRAHERQIVAETFKAERAQRTEAFRRLIENVERIIGPKGKPFLTTLSPEQLRQFIELDAAGDDGKPYWTEAQRAALAKALAEHEKQAAKAQPKAEPDEDVIVGAKKEEENGSPKD